MALLRVEGDLFGDEGVVERVEVESWEGHLEWWLLGWLLLLLLRLLNVLEWRDGGWHRATGMPTFLGPKGEGEGCSLSSGGWRYVACEASRV